MNRLFLFTLFVALAALAAAQQRTPTQSPAQTMDRKLRWIESNGAKPKPDTRPVVLTEDEVNDYFALGKVELPKGVKRVRFHGTPGKIDTTARVDFDVIREGRDSYNPLLYLFSGEHDVQVIAEAHGQGGTGVVTIESVSIDGMKVPRMALEYFVEKYITSKYPEVGMISRFRMPHRIHTATVGDRKLTLAQQ